MNTTAIRLALLGICALTLGACSTMNPTSLPDSSYTPPVDNPLPPVAQQKYVVQLTASSSQTKAEGIRNMFYGTHYNAFVSPLMVNGRLLHRVQIGYFNNEHDAYTTLAQLRQDYPRDVYVADAIVKTP
ncbi:MAG: SPOR domain-containing protein [Thiolinea sp.]